MERDDTIQEKEKRIYDLKKKNQELEKFKFVLDYKIKELKKQIEPRERDIRNQQESGFVIIFWKWISKLLKNGLPVCFISHYTLRNQDRNKFMRWSLNWSVSISLTQP